MPYPISNGNNRLALGQNTAAMSARCGCCSPLGQAVLPTAHGPPGSEYELNTKTPMRAIRLFVIGKLMNLTLSYGAQLRLVSCTLACVIPCTLACALRGHEICM